MTRRVRTVLLLAGLVGLAVVLLLAWLQLPGFGGPRHPYRDLAVVAGVGHATANLVSSVNFDQRAFDTFGEESILVAVVAGVAALLRAGREEERVRPSRRGRVLDSTRVLVAVLLPVTLLVGVDVVTHGAVTPGGGFQGGVILATGLHLLYVGGRYPLLQRLRPLDLVPPAEAAGLLLYAAVGLGGLAIGGSFLKNVIPTGTLADLVSSGTVPLLSAAVGLAVGASIVVLLAHFLEQALVIREKPGGPPEAEEEAAA